MLMPELGRNAEGYCRTCGNDLGISGICSYCAIKDIDLEALSEKATRALEREQTLKELVTQYGKWPDGLESAEFTITISNDELIDLWLELKRLQIAWGDHTFDSTVEQGDYDE